MNQATWMLSEPAYTSMNENVNVGILHVGALMILCSQTNI